MAIELRWAGEADLDRVARTRLRCYAKSAVDEPKFCDWIRKDPRCGLGDFLLAEDGGQAVGTATHVSYQMHLRGGVVPCQGVAWVGAIKTMRRRGDGASPGIASAVMHAMLARARDRGDVVSALMPFRASYYEHFGYGVVEQRVDWTIPIAALPAGPFDGIRYYESGDFTARADGLQRVNQQGQCDIERSAAYWQTLDETAAEGFAMIDRPGDGPARGSFTMTHQQTNGRDIMKINDQVYDSPAALRRQLHFLASQKDQFAAAQLTLPADVPLNWLLKESQIPHRPVNHPVAEPRPYTRMQLRVLDHGRCLQAMRLPAHVSGKTVVAVHESEGHTSTFSVEIDAGHLTVKPTQQSALFECSDRAWAAVVSGAVKATDAVHWGLATGNGELLDALAAGPMPFCHEYF